MRKWNSSESKVGKTCVLEMILSYNRHMKLLHKHFPDLKDASVDITPMYDELVSDWHAKVWDNDESLLFYARPEEHRACIRIEVFL